MDGFWDDADAAAKVQKEKYLLESVVNTYLSLKELHDEYEILLDYAELEGDRDSALEAHDIVGKFLKTFAEAEQKVLLSEEADPNNAIITINAGAGGTESCDWANMLLRMIIRWGENKKFKIQVISIQAGETAGIK